MRSYTRTARATGLLLLIPLVTPEIVAGVSAFVLFAQLGVALSLTTVILAHITFSISYVTIVVRGRLASLGAELEEAALDLGATPWQAVRLVAAVGSSAPAPRRSASAALSRSHASQRARRPRSTSRSAACRSASSSVGGGGA